jgi:hypothetical protein
MQHAPDIRLRKLHEIAQQLKSGKAVQNRMLKTWLGDEAYENYEADWLEQQQIRNELTEKPEAVKKYEELLGKGNFYNNRSLAAETRSQAAHSTLDDKATDCYERALEHLQESILEDSSLRVWFDRELDFTEGSDLDASADGMPQVVTSRSERNKGGGFLLSKQTKRETKLAAVETEIRKLRIDAGDFVDRGALLADLLGRDVTDN